MAYLGGRKARCKILFPLFFFFVLNPQEVRNSET